VRGPEPKYPAVPFAEYAKACIEQALAKTPGDVAADVYVVSLFVYYEEDDPRLPTVTVGFNTEAQVAKSTDDAFEADEARWNFASWLQNELGVLADTDRDPEGAALREQWVRSEGLWYEEQDGDDAYDDEAGGEITDRFLALIGGIAEQNLRATRTASPTTSRAGSSGCELTRAALLALMRPE